MQVARMALLKNLARQTIPRWLRNGLRSPRRTAQWWINDILPPVPFQIRRDWTLQCPRNAFEAAYRHQVEDPVQAEELDDFIRAVRSQKKTVFLDIGAHFGIFSFAALHYGGPESRALAVDPSGVAIRMIRRVAALNGAAQRVRAIQAAAGRESGELEMVEAGVTAAGYMVLPADHPPSERTRIPLVTIDSLADSPEGCPTLIKVDVEGFELDVLRGGERTLRDQSIPLCLELHNAMIRERGGDPREVLDLLGESGYARFSAGAKDQSTRNLLHPDVMRFVAFKA